jgi:energy-coupling factor transporter ATP-binding protein EcfA2
MKKIILTGTHCTGKSTILNQLRGLNRPDITCVDEMIRTLALIENFRFICNPDSQDELHEYAFSEKALTSFYRGIAEFGQIKRNSNFTIMDRCILDPLYYSTYFKLNKMLSNGISLRQSLINDIREVLVKHNFFLNADVYLLTPKPLDVADEFRLKGEECQLAVHQIARTTLELFDINYKEVSCEEAYSSILKSINEVVIYGEKKEVIDYEIKNERTGVWENFIAKKYAIGRSYNIETEVNKDSKHITIYSHNPDNIYNNEYTTSKYDSFYMGDYKIQKDWGLTIKDYYEHKK